MQAKISSFLGPGLLVAVGYMDPGNWITSMQGGAQFGYILLFIILVSSLSAMLLQSMTVRLGIATDMDCTNDTLLFKSPVSNYVLDNSRTSYYRYRYC